MLVYGTIFTGWCVSFVISYFRRFPSTFMFLRNNEQCFHCSLFLMNRVLCCWTAVDWKGGIVAEMGSGRKLLFVVTSFLTRTFFHKPLNSCCFDFVCLCCMVWAELSHVCFHEREKHYFHMITVGCGHNQWHSPHLAFLYKSSQYFVINTYY